MTFTRPNQPALIDFVRRQCLALLACALPLAALAQAPLKEPSGPNVAASGNPPGWNANADSIIQFTVTFTNTQPLPLPLTFQDNIADPNCSDDPDLLFFADDDADGVCDTLPFIEVVNGGTPNIACDVTNQTIDITNITVQPGATLEIRFQAKTGPAAGGIAMGCNQGFFLTQFAPIPTMDPLTGDPCTCLSVTDTGGEGFSAEKTVTLDNGPLIPGDMTRTATFDIDVVNTGQDQQTINSFIDQLPAGLEFIPPALACPTGGCNFPSPSRMEVDTFAIDGGEMLRYSLRAYATCAAATDDDSAMLCNQAELTTVIQGNPFTIETDDPNTPTIGDATCVPVIYSDLTETEKELVDWVDDNPANGQIDAGERLNFRITAINRGRLTATDVVVTDDLTGSTCFDLDSIVVEDGGTNTAGVLTWDNIGNLAPGVGFAEVHFSVVLQADETCCNQATVNSAERIACQLGGLLSDDPSTPAADDDPTCASPGPQPDLVVTKSWECVGRCSDPPVVDDTVMWTVTIRNEGSAPATAAEFRDAMATCHQDFDPANITISGEGDPSGSTPSQRLPFPAGGTVLVTGLGGVDGIQPAEEIVITWETTFAFLAEGCCNQGVVDCAEATCPTFTDDPGTPGVPDDQTCPNREPVPPGTLYKPIDLGPGGDLRTFIDNDGNGVPTQGDTVLYTLIFTNSGDATLTNVEILDPGLARTCVEFDVSTVQISPIGAPVNPLHDASVAPDLRVTIDSLEPAEGIEITFEATIVEAGPIANCCNQAEWTSAEIAPEFMPSDSDLAPTSPTGQPTCFPVREVIVPEVSVTKSLLTTGCVQPGDTVTWEVTVTNNSDVQLDDWDLTDDLDPAFTNVASVPTGGPEVCIAGNLVTFDDTCAGYGPLGAQSSMTFQYEATIPCDPAQPTGSLGNTARMTFRDPSGGGQASGTATVDWDLPQLTVEKTWDFSDDNASGGAEPGEPVTFTITVTNPAANGCEARNVVVTDDVAAEFDQATFSSPDGDFSAPPTVRWDGATTPALASIAAGDSVVLQFTIDVNRPPPDGDVIGNEAVAAADQCDAAFGLEDTFDIADGQGLVPWGAPGQGGGPELIWNHDVAQATATATGPGSMRGEVFLGDVANFVCGNTNVTPSADVVPQPVDGPSLAAGVTANGNTDGEFVIFEVTEYCSCDLDEPPAGAAADYLDLIVVEHDGNGGFIVRTIGGTGGGCP